jgi:hypothetical protein
LGATEALLSGLPSAPPSPSLAPGWGAEIDWDYVRTRTVGQY